MINQSQFDASTDARLIAISRDGDFTTLSGLFYLMLGTLVFHLSLYLYGRFLPDLMITTPFMLVLVYTFTLLRGLLPVVTGHHRYYTSQFVPEMAKTFRIAIGGILFFALGYFASGLIPVPADPIQAILRNILALAMLNGIGLVMVLGGLVGVIALVAIAMQHLYLNSPRD